MLITVADGGIFYQFFSDLLDSQQVHVIIIAYAKIAMPMITQMVRQYLVKHSLAVLHPSMSSSTKSLANVCFTLQVKTTKLCTQKGLSRGFILLKTQEFRSFGNGKPYYRSNTQESFEQKVSGIVLNHILSGRKFYWGPSSTDGRTDKYCWEQPLDLVCCFLSAACSSCKKANVCTFLLYIAKKQEGEMKEE